MRWLKVVDAITRARYLVNIDHIWEIGVELYNIVPDKPGRWCLMIRFQGKKTPSTLKMYTDCQIPPEYITEQLMHQVQDCIADY